MHGGYSGIPCGSIIHILCIRWWSGHNGSGGGTVEPVGADASSVQFPGVRRWEGFGAEVGNTRSSTILYRIIIKGREARDCTIARPCGACLVFSPPSSFHRGGLGCSWWTGSICCNIQQCITHGSTASGQDQERQQTSAESSNGFFAGMAPLYPHCQWAHPQALPF